MRVLHVTPYFAPAFSFGGPPRSILALCHGQQAVGIDVEVVTTNATGGPRLSELPAATVYEGVPVRYLPLRGWAPLFWAPDMLRELRALAPAADVIHSHGLFNATTWVAHRAAGRTDRPLVVSVRGMLQPRARRHHELRKRLAWRLFDRHVVEDAAVLHTTSDSETESVRQVTSSRVVQIANAVAPGAPVAAAARAELRRKLGGGRGMPLVVFVGRLHPIKRLDLLAAAFAQVAGVHPGAHLVIAGAGDERVRRQAESFLGPAAARTTWLGEVAGAERDALLAEATVFVLCSDSENFGMGVAEALAAGAIPVVTQTCPWQLLQTERVGHWVPQTADAIANAIGQVLNNPVEREAMGDRARAAARRFQPALVGESWKAVYASIKTPTTHADVT